MADLDADTIAEIERRHAEIGRLLAALKAAAGYMRNAAIDLETGAPKKTALATIEGGLDVVTAAIDRAESRS